jgi:hypothetical protein
MNFGGERPSRPLHISKEHPEFLGPWPVSCGGASHNLISFIVLVSFFKNLGLITQA